MPSNGSTNSCAIQLASQKGLEDPLRLCLIFFSIDIRHRISISGLDIDSAQSYVFLTAVVIVANDCSLVDREAVFGCGAIGQIDDTTVSIGYIPYNSTTMLHILPMHAS